MSNTFALQNRSDLANNFYLLILDTKIFCEKSEKAINNTEVIATYDNYIGQWSKWQIILYLYNKALNVLIEIILFNNAFYYLIKFSGIPKLEFSFYNITKRNIWEKPHLSK